MVSAASGLTDAAAAATNTNSTALSKLDGDFQSFLKLLTVQLQNQDPTEPLDTNQLTDQITQFSQVEQQINTNKSLTKMLEAQQTSAINSAVSYIDRFVEFDSSEFYQRSGTSPILSYTLPEQAQNVTVSITSDTGRVLYSQDVTASGSSPKTAHPIAWDGKDSTGNAVANGKYKVNVTATNIKGDEMKGITTAVTDMVTEVSVQNGEVMLTMGDLNIAASKVKTIKGLYAEVDTPNTPETTTDTNSETTTETTGS